MRADSVAVLFTGVAVAMAWGIAMTVLREVFAAPVAPFELGAVMGSPGDRLMGVEVPEHGVDLRWWVSLLIAIPATFAVHEVVHALFFRRYAPPGARVKFGANLNMGMIYASAEGVVYPRAAYLVIALAPSVVVTLLVAVLGIGIKWPLWAIVIATIHLSGCTGDWGYVRAIRADPAIAYCEDTAWGVVFYGADERRRPRAPRSPSASRPARSRGEASGFSVVDGGRRP